MAGDSKREGSQADRCDRGVWEPHDASAADDGDGRFDRLVHLLPHGLVELDVEGRIVFCNERYARMHERTPEDLTGVSVLSLHPPEIRQEMRGVLERVAREEPKPFRWRIRIPQRQADPLEVDVHWTYRRDAAGALIGYECVLTDVTEWIRSVQELRQSREQLELTLRATRDGFWEWRIDEDTVWVSDRWLELLGYRREEIEPTAEGIAALYHPDDAEEIARRTREHVAGGADLYALESRLLDADGLWRWVEVRGEVVERDERGRGVRMVGTIRDIQARKEAEHKLQRANAELGLALELANLGAWSIDAATGESFWSEQMYAIFAQDRSAGPIALEDYFDRVVPEDRERLRLLVDGALERGEGFRARFRYRRSPDDVRHMISLARVETDAKGRPVRLHGTTQDVTEYVHSAGQLNRLDRQRTHVLDSISEAFFSLDEQFRVTYWNRAAERVLGISASEALGKDLLETFPEARGSVFEEKYREALRTKEPVQFETYFEPHPYADWYEVRVYPQEEGISVYFQVVTERRRAEQALRESERAFRDLAENSTDYIMRYDRGHRHVYINASGAKICQLTPEDFDGKTHREMGFPEPMCALWEERIDRVFRTGEPDGAEFEFDSPVKGKMVLDWRLVPERDEEGNIVTVLGVSRDITEIRRAEQLQAQIQQAQKLESLGVLAGGIAHDFNNLLMGILGNADLALMEMSQVSPARPSVEDIKTAATRAADLCRQMLAYSGKGRFYVEPVNLSEVVEEMTHMLEVSISKRAILRYNFAETLPAVEADVTQLRQVIMNLITNASEAIGDRSGVISVTTGVMHCDREYLSETYLDDDLPEGPYVYAEIADTGCGMDDEARVRLFEPFFTTKFAGRGLGLAAVLGIIRGHRGAIKVYSEPSKGTTVKVLLPVSDQPVASGEDEASPQPAIRLDGKVLLVDDEETVRLVASRMLERLGFEVVTASDGSEALGILEGDSDGFSCVLLDLTMPHMDGEETFREIRRLAPHLPVIISSGYNQQEVTQRFLGKGLAGFVQKPYQLASLLNVIRSAMED